MDGLTHLGKQTNEPTEKLDLIPWGGGKTVVTLNCSEFTSHCPVTKQPDFGSLIITYAPDQNLAETKSVKLYLWRFRDTAKFNERIVDELATDFFAQVKPRWVRVEGQFHPRGGISVTAVGTRGEAP